MAKVVEGCTELLCCYTSEGHKSPFPLMRVDGNIYVLPGVPSTMRSKWPHIKECLVDMYSWRTAQFKNRYSTASCSADLFSQDFATVHQFRDLVYRILVRNSLCTARWFDIFWFLGVWLLSSRRDAARTVLAVSSQKQHQKECIKLTECAELFFPMRALLVGSSVHVLFFLVGSLCRSLPQSYLLV